MSYFVYRPLKNQESFPKNWEVVSEHETQAEAELAAIKLCKATADNIDTEPGHGLDRCYFGRKSSNKWSAMISLEKLQ